MRRILFVILTSGKDLADFKDASLSFSMTNNA